VTVLIARWSGYPPGLETRLQELVCGRLVIPHGDRRDVAQSRGTEDDDERLGDWHDGVVCELVLNYDVRDHGRS